MLCVWSHFSRVQLFATPWTAAQQVPLSVWFSRQEYWSGVPFPPPGDLPNLCLWSLLHLQVSSSATWEALYTHTPIKTKTPKPNNQLYSYTKTKNKEVWVLLAYRQTECPGDGREKWEGWVLAHSITEVKGSRKNGEAGRMLGVVAWKVAFRGAISGGEKSSATWNATERLCKMRTDPFCVQFWVSHPDMSEVSRICSSSSSILSTWY